MRWAGKVECMGKMKNVYDICGRKPHRGT